MREILKLRVSQVETDQYLRWLNDKLSENNTLLLKSSIEKCKEILTVVFCLHKTCTCLTHVKLQYQKL